MRADLRIFDNTSLTAEEVRARLESALGCKPISIDVYPDSNDPLDHLYFGIQGLITHQQLDLIFESGALYQDKLKTLRAEVLAQIEVELDRVIADNEQKVSN